jgi:hypothetical protein
LPPAGRGPKAARTGSTRRQAIPVDVRAEDFPVRRLNQSANAFSTHPGDLGRVVPKGVPDMGRRVPEVVAAEVSAEALGPIGLVAGRYTTGPKARIGEITAKFHRLGGALLPGCRAQTPFLNE